MRLLEILGLRDRGLRPIERAILGAVADHLEGAAGDLMRKQIDQVNLVQRHSDDTEVNLYPMRRGGVWLDEELRFVLDRPEARLATVMAREAGRPTPIRADVWIADRRVFSIVFSEPPRTRDAPTEIAEVTLWVDPMRPEHDRTDSPDPEGVIEWLGALAGEWGVSEVLGPPARVPGDSTGADMDDDLPIDLPPLLRITGGFRIGAWVVHGLRSLRTIVLDQGEFMVLSEGPEGAILAARRGDGGRRVFWLHPDLEAPVEVSDTLKGALSAALEGEVGTGAE